MDWWGGGGNSSVGTVTFFGLDGPGIKFCRGREFPHKSRGALGTTQPAVQWVLGHCGKTAGTWHWPPTPSRAGVKERVELYLYSPSGPSWTVLGGTSPLPLFMFRSNRLEMDWVLYDEVMGPVPFTLFWYLCSYYEGWNFNSGNYLFTTDTK